MHSAVGNAVLPLVIKIGGSLAKSGRLADILKTIEVRRRPVVIVPGGGVFADAVRDAQQQMGFDDALAHRLALHAMQQMAEVFVALSEAVTMVETLDGIVAALQSGEVPVWLPLAMLENDASIPADWSMTSDGIAAWLGERLGGAAVVLLKSAPVARDAGLEALQNSGIVDPVFPIIVRRARLDWSVLGAGDMGLFEELLKGEMSAARHS